MRPTTAALACKDLRFLKLTMLYNGHLSHHMEEGLVYRPRFERQFLTWSVSSPNRWAIYHMSLPTMLHDRQLWLALISPFPFLAIPGRKEQTLGFLWWLPNPTTKRILAVFVGRRKRCDNEEQARRRDSDELSGLKAFFFRLNRRFLPRARRRAPRGMSSTRKIHRGKNR